MGVHIIRVPDIGEGIAEVELVAWYVGAGDRVREDQPLADVMTDKASVEIPSPVNGKVLALGGQLGQMMAVGSELIRIEVSGRGNAEAEAEKGISREAAPAADQSADCEESRETDQAADQASSHPDDQAPDHQESHPLVEPSSATAMREEGAPLASPAVRRRAWDLGIELRFVSGTGPHGRIRHQDLDAWLAAGGQGPASIRSSTALTPRIGKREVPVIGLRRRIAEKMQQAKRRIPHFTYVEEVDVTELEKLRLELNARYADSRGKLTLIPFVARAMVLALRDFPQINACFDDEAGVVTRYEGVHLGVAVQTADGLMVTVLRHAESRDLWGQAAELARLAALAREGQASREELSGSTITLSSLGALGGIVSTPVINHPEVAIIAVNRIDEKPVVRDAQVVIRKTMNLSSSFDHRVVDGMDAAAFIQAVRRYLQTPAMLFID